ncbi:MAG TPA: ABC transporter permease subunit [Planctomycetaceae bacterium]|nr:ABC transporter permease subunit [Planctomycetaceae bacterium]
MLAGPIFSREALTSPRTLRHYLIRSGYVAVLFVLMYTLGQVTFGWQQQRHLGELARFGGLLFQVFSLLQLTLVLFFALLFAAGNVAQEKDRKTLVLLLMTDLRNRELVIGKLSASLLVVAVLILSSFPAFTLAMLLGGISLEQIGWSLAITASAALAAGSWGSFVAFWREKTFQTLAYSVLGLVLFLGVVEGTISLLGAANPVSGWLALLDPFRGMLLILDPLAQHGLRGPTAAPWAYVAALLLVAVALSGSAILRLRVWNPSDALWLAPKTEKATKTTPTRAVWHNPVIWREIRTSAYGRKVFVIKLAYLLVFLAAAWFAGSGNSGELVLGMISAPGFAFVGLGVLSLMLVNAQAVTALTTERDAKTLELLLVTDITAREFIFGKLGGVLYNAKEVVLLPCGLLVWYLINGTLGFENFLYVLVGFLMLTAFSAMLGLHSGLAFENSRTAIANSLGTMFFLFLGIFICMMLILEARSSFFLQLPSFLVFILGGSLALSASLTHKNPSTALTISAFTLPFFTFYAITGFLLHETLGVWLVIMMAYGFPTVAMLVPAISEFDVALGRTTLDRG